MKAKAKIEKKELVQGLKTGEPNATAYILEKVESVAASLAENFSKVFNLEQEEINDEIICHLYDIIKTNISIDNSYLLSNLKKYGKRFIYGKVSTMYDLSIEEIDAYYNFISMIHTSDYDIDFILNHDECTVCNVMNIRYFQLLKFKSINYKIHDSFLNIHDVKSIASQDEGIDMVDMGSALTNLLHNLHESERVVIVLRFGLEDGRNRTLQQVGDELNLDISKIRGLERRALRKLRHPSQMKFLKDLMY